MSRRTRAIAFGGAALLCAVLAAGIAGGYRSDVVAQLGALRAVVVASKTLPAGRAIEPEAVEGSLELRRVPARFVPPGALAAPAAAVGRAPTAPIPAGAYVLAPQLAAPEPDSEGSAPRDSLRAGRRPVEIGVAGARSLAAAPGGPPARVDVVVTTEPGPGGGAGRTYVAAERVRLLELRPGGGSSAGTLPGSAPVDAIATLALSRDQALRLIQAESFARQVRLIGR